MNVNLSEIRRRTVTPNDYISSLEEASRGLFLAKKRNYALHSEALPTLRKFADRIVVVAFSASWCKDCAEQIPVLALLSDATGLEVRIFGGIKKDPLSQICKWRIPPSPPEVVTLHVDKLPTMIVFGLNGNEIGRIEEHPRTMPTLEQELNEIVKSHNSDCNSGITT